MFTQRAVKPRPSGRGYKAHLDWNFCLSAFCVLTGDTAAGHAVSACGEIVRPGGIGGWFVPVKFPTWECLRRKPSLVPLGSLGEAGTRSGTQSQDCLRWESPDFRRGRMSKGASFSPRKASESVEEGGHEESIAFLPFFSGGGAVGAKKPMR